MTAELHRSRLEPPAVVYTEKIPPNQIKPESVSVNCSKIWINFEGSEKNFYGLERRMRLRI